MKRRGESASDWEAVVYLKGCCTLHTLDCAQRLRWSVLFSCKKLFSWEYRGTMQQEEVWTRGGVYIAFRWGRCRPLPACRCNFCSWHSFWNPSPPSGGHSSPQWDRNKGSDSKVRSVLGEISLEPLQPYLCFYWKAIAPPGNSSRLQEKVMVEDALLSVEQKNLHWIVFPGVALVTPFHSAIIKSPIHLRN